MRTAGMIMGIVGGAFALLFAVLLILGSVAITNLVPWNNTYEYDYDYDDFNNWNDFNDYDDFSNWDDFNDYDNNFISNSTARNIAGTVFLIPGICGVIAGVMGLVGGIIIRKKNVASGVLMIIAAVLSLICFFNIVSMVLFILGGVFALMRDRQKVVYAPPYPMPPNYAYPEQPYPSQQYPQQSASQPEQPQNPPEQSES